MFDATYKTFTAYNAARQIARHATASGSDDSSFYTLDFVAGEFVIVEHYGRATEVFARCADLAALKVARRRMPRPDEDGEGCGHVVAITVAADQAMRCLAR